MLATSKICVNDEFGIVKQIGTIQVGDQVEVFGRQKPVTVTHVQHLKAEAPATMVYFNKQLTLQPNILMTRDAKNGPWTKAIGVRTGLPAVLPTADLVFLTLQDAYPVLKTPCGWFVFPKL